MLILTLADYYSLSYLAFTKYQIRLLSLLYLWEEILASFTVQI